MHRAGLELLLEVASQSQPQRGRREAVADELLESGAVAFWALFEGDVAATFGTLYAPALPEIEQVMLADWLGRSLALYEVVAVDRAVSLTLPTSTRARCWSSTIARRRIRTSWAISCWRASAWSTASFAMSATRSPSRRLHRDRTLALVQGQPNAADMAVWYAEVSAG